MVDGQNRPGAITRSEGSDVQPTVAGYGSQLDKSDLMYNLTYEKVLDDQFNRAWTIDHMLMGRQIPAGEGGE